jgi:hypothetical protein
MKWRMRRTKHFLHNVRSTLSLAKGVLLELHVVVAAMMLVVLAILEFRHIVGLMAK